MRAHEFIFEVKAGKIRKSAQQSSRGINTYGDQERINGDYVGFKLGQAMAMSDGGSGALDIDPKSWYGKKKTVHPYSDIEQRMFDQGAKAVGASSKDMNSGDMKSKELDGTNNVSPVSNWNKKKKATESVSAGVTSTASIGANTAVAPRAKQKKKKNGTAVNALDGDSIFASPARR